MNEYNHKVVESKWQEKWEQEKTFKTDINSSKPKYYALDMFPYPSGAGLHVGHPEGYTATDIVSRMKRMQGFEVLHPIGWDAFGLPAEQYAIKTGNNPDGFTQTNIDTFKKQIKSLGFSYDWDREINTTDPKYFKWTQWIFIQLYNKGLAELKDTYVNFCPECGTVLANEEVINGKCERAGHDVIKKRMKQWSLKITHYADRLLEDLEDLDWPESLKEMQRNWIGKSIGAEIDFKLEGSNEKISVFTTRADTIFGVTYVVIAPDGELAQKLVTKEYEEKLSDYINDIKNKSDLERTELNKDKTGMFIGSYAIHPFTNEKLPIWVADYVLDGYGTGAVMAVSAHDQRDYEFAQKYNLEIKQVIEGDISSAAYTEDGVHINSDFIDGMNIDEAKEAIVNRLQEDNLGKEKINYKLRDWLFSRQRYWGEPFPIAYLEDGSIKVLDEKELPIMLPKMDKIEVTGDGTSPLAKATDWLDYTDPITGQKGKRETNTMPQWAGSCWYYIRYIDPNNDDVLVNFEDAKKWLPVDLYIGGAEHAVLHLLYARFWHKVLYDIGVVDSKEPFQRLFNQGMILGENNEKMSKSKGNVINPDDIVESHGADTLRLYEMFMGPLDASIAWSETGLDGARKFLDKIWRLYQEVEFDDNFKENDVIYNQTVKKVTNDYEKLSFNTAISQMMIFINHISKTKKMTNMQAASFLKLLMPIAPHICEEINNVVLNKEQLTYSSWPMYDEKLTVSSEVEIVVQVLGKIKAKIIVSNDITKEKQLELSKEAVKELLEDKIIVKEIVVEKKLTNFVVR